MANHQIDIFYNPNWTTAYWELEGKQPTPIPVATEDTVSFTFNGPGTLASAILLTGTLLANQPSSPFPGGSQINIAPNYPLSIAGSMGLWGFTVSFTTLTDGVSNFYYLADPELEVGSVSPAPPANPA